METAEKKIYKYLLIFVLQAGFAAGLLADVKTSGPETGPGEKTDAEVSGKEKSSTASDDDSVEKSNPEQTVFSSDIFISGTEGYNTFRIPSITVTKTGTILAFCEGRKNGRSDSGDIDTVLKRSVDGGKTWSDLR